MLVLSDAIFASLDFIDLISVSPFVSFIKNQMVPMIFVELHTSYWSLICI